MIDDRDSFHDNTQLPLTYRTCKCQDLNKMFDLNEKNTYKARALNRQAKYLDIRNFQIQHSLYHMAYPTDLVHLRNSEHIQNQLA